VLGPVTVRPLVEAVIEASRTLIDEAGLTVEVDVPESLPPVLGDEPALRRVFQNLLGNAIKYGAGGGTIRIAAAARRARSA
jgi:two-component system, OmpR family, phosphate regulon sensor histidine kinase PhoR